MFLGQQQRFSFPTVYGAQKKVYKTEYEKANEIQKKLSLEISKYIIILFIYKTKKLYFYLDSLYQNFSKKQQTF
jgi:cobalt-zinc-cadmium resistance protein CzcA